MKWCPPRVHALLREALGQQMTLPVVAVLAQPGHRHQRREAVAGVAVPARPEHRHQRREVAGVTVTVLAWPGNRHQRREAVAGVTVLARPGNGHQLREAAGVPAQPRAGEHRGAGTGAHCQVRQHPPGPLNSQYRMKAPRQSHQIVSEPAL
jgi:hypothetical protein